MSSFAIFFTSFIFDLICKLKHYLFREDPTGWSFHFKLILDTSAILMIIRIQRSFDGSYPGFLPQILGAAIVFLFAIYIQYVDGSTLF